MKKLKTYINTMYPLAFYTLAVGLAVFALSLCLLAVSLRKEMLAGESDLIYRYPRMLQEITMPILVVIPISLIIDMNERKKKS